MFLLIANLIPALSVERQPAESWFLITFDNKPVGYEQISTWPLKGKNPAEIACLRKTHLNLTRMGKNLSLRASLWTEQTSDGQLRSFSLFRTHGSGSRVHRSGQLTDNERIFKIIERRTGARRQTDIQLSQPPYSPIFTLWLPQLAASSTGRLTVPTFFPESPGVANITLEKKSARKIRLAGGTSIKARQISFFPQLDPTRTTVLYTDDEQAVLRQEKILFGGILAISRSTADAALAAVSDKSIDLDAQSFIPIDRLFKSPLDRKALTIEISVSGGFIGDMPSSEFQQVERIDDNRLRITLTRPDLTTSRVPASPDPAHSALATSTWFPLRDPTVVRLAAIGAGPESDPVKTCSRLAQFVHSKMKRSAFSTAIRSADAVARDLRGDCTEHAILLAALMRARGIPARVVTGLMHTSQQLGFVGHMWVEALIDDQWIPFDSTGGLELKSATRIKLSDSELSNSVVSGAALFLPVLVLVGRTEVHVVADD